MGSASNEERELRAARNQALFRAVNEKMRELNEAFRSLVGTYSIACECSSLECVEILEIPDDVYRAVRESPRRFAVRAGHCDPAVERIVSEQDGYAIVEAVGTAAQIADATFDRDTGSATLAEA